VKESGGLLSSRRQSLAGGSSTAGKRGSSTGQVGLLHRQTLRHSGQDRVHESALALVQRLEHLFLQARRRLARLDAVPRLRKKDDLIYGVQRAALILVLPRVAPSEMRGIRQMRASSRVRLGTSIEHWVRAHHMDQHVAQHMPQHHAWHVSHGHMQSDAGLKGEHLLLVHVVKVGM